MTRILVAMERDAQALGIPCEIIGIGAADVPMTSEEDVLVNVGYCGAAGFYPGTVVEPDEAIPYGGTEGRKLDTHFGCIHAPCFTSPEFVTRPCGCSDSIYDMELVKITALPHRELYVLKIVSDNLNEPDCEAFNDGKAWEQVREMLREKKLV